MGISIEMNARNSTTVLCVRFDLDTFSTRTDFIAKVGAGEYAYLPLILSLGKEHGARFQFCACGEGLLEYPNEVRAIREAGHSVDSHLHTHKVHLNDPLEKVKGELILAEEAFRQHGIPWTGIGATGMYKNGIDGHADIIQLLAERGYRWCSSKYNIAKSLEESQPYWLRENLLEIPFTGWSDMGWWYYREEVLKWQIHPQNIVENWSLDGFTAHFFSHLHRAKEQGLLYLMCLHAGALSKHDPECKVLAAILSEARHLGIPMMDMNQIYQLELAKRMAGTR